jgi:hypothetical protein
MSAADRNAIVHRLPHSCGALTLCLAAGAVGAALTASAQPEIYGHPDSSGFYLIPPDTDDWTRHFRLGALAAFNIGAHFNINPNQMFNGISGNNVAKGIYDDGYVRTDQTGNAGGLTSYWGYNNASQYNAANNTLTMSATTGYSIPRGGSANTDVGPAVGVDLSYGANFWYWKHARVGFDLGLTYLPISISDYHTLTANITQSTYTFSTGGIVMPGAGYQGGPSGVGPLIGSNSGTPTESSQMGVQVTGHRTLDANLFAIRLGPSMYWDLGDSVGMQLSAGPVLGIVDGEYSYNETLGGTAHNVGSFDSVGIQYGGYVSANFDYHVNQSVDLYIGAQYMTMTDYTISSGGREGSLDLGGQIYISAGINWPF